MMLEQFRIALAKQFENPKQKPLDLGEIKGLQNLAERVGFEPTVRGNRTPDFESGTFDHSATFPGIPTRCCFVGSKRVVAWEKKIIKQLESVFQAPRRKNF